MKRRHFLRNSSLSLLAAGSPLLRALEADNQYRNEIGLQLYTLRNQLKKDVPLTIAALAKMGYKQVEMYGFPDCDDVIAAAKAEGLAINSSHFQWNSVLDAGKEGVPSFDAILEKANEVGLKHLVIPYLEDRHRENLDGYKTVAEKCNKAAVKAKAAGIQLAYHNHAFEFKPMADDGKCGYDVLMAEFAPEMQFEVDVFWVKAGGRDPKTQIEAMKGRVSQLHLKDLKKDVKLPEFGKLENDAFQELGDGMIPMEPLIEVAKAVGVSHCHVEQDQSPDPLASVEQSIQYLNGL